MHNFLFNQNIQKSFGLNLKFKNTIVKSIGLNSRKHPSFLQKSLHLKFYYSLKQKFIVEKQLLRSIRENLLFLKSNKNFRGIRHLLNLPTRGQRTHTNAKTKKRLKN